VPDSGSVKVLLVDADAPARTELRRALVLAGWDVVVAGDGRAGLEAVLDELPDAVTLAAELPDVDGLDFCRRLRDFGERVPVLMLAEHADVPDRVAGLNAGADDYLGKPCDPGELHARLRSLVRRNGNGSWGSLLRFAELELDGEEHVARIGARTVRLTRTEFRLLELFMLNPRRVLGAELIYDRVWGYDFGQRGNALRVYVGYLRRKLEAAGERRLLHTLRGVGYVLREPEPERGNGGAAPR
jgi:two-component system response regulator MprA